MYVYFRHKRTGSVYTSGESVCFLQKCIHFRPEVYTLPQKSIHFRRKCMYFSWKCMLFCKTVYTSGRKCMTFCLKCMSFLKSVCLLVGNTCILDKILCILDKILCILYTFKGFLWKTRYIFIGKFVVLIENAYILSLKS